MTFPVLTCEIAFGSPTTGSVWTSVTDRLAAFSVRRGRNSELDEFQAGTASVELHNNDRALDPANAASPFAPNVKPFRRLRLGTMTRGVVSPFFTGYIEDYEQQTRGPATARVILPVVDGFAALSLAKLNGSFPQQRSDLRIDAALSAARWTTGTSWLLGVPGFSELGVTTIVGPFGDRVLYPGLSEVVGETLANVSALGHIQDVARAELGWFFVDARGAAVFVSRLWLARSPYSVSQATFGDRPDAGELPYVDATPTYGLEQVWNEVRVTATGGAEQIAADTASQDEYFIRTLARTVPLTSDVESLSQAKYLVSRFKDPIVRLTHLGLDPEGYLPEQVWPQALGRELGDLITVRFRPVGGGAAIDQESQIHGIEHRWSAETGVWETTWSVAPRQVGMAWVLGDPGSRLGVNTVLSY